MSELAAKWNKKFAEHTCEATAACDVLADNQHLLPTNAKALDFACGLGGNAVLLAELELETHAWDISRVALDKLDHYAKVRKLNISTYERDVEIYPPEPHSFDVIVVSNFLHRPSFSKLIKALRKDGLLFYQTFTANKVTDIGPTNPDFLLGKNELLELCIELEILVYREEGMQGNTASGFRNQAMIVAKSFD